MNIQRFSWNFSSGIYPNDNGNLCYFKSHEAIILEKQKLINLFEKRVEDLENENRILRAGSSTCKRNK